MLILILVLAIIFSRSRKKKGKEKPQNNKKGNMYKQDKNSCLEGC